MRIKRRNFNDLLFESRDRRLSILLGARQVGKTTLMRQLEEALRREGRSTVFYNLELSSDLERLAGDDKTVFEKLTSSAEIVFVDEFHYLRNASKLFKAIHDSDRKVKIYASGSSSLEIHKHLKESLAGRFLKTMIFPLSSDEMAQIPAHSLEAYLRWGGLPGLIHESSEEGRVRLIENIVSTYLSKDIKGLIQEENVRAFNSLLYILAQNQGSLVVLSNLARETGLSEPTVARHLEIMGQTYVCHPLLSYSKNMANELKKSKKFFLFDIGIRNGLLKDFRTSADRPDRGVLNETFVFLHLLPQLKPNMEVRFWRTKKGDEVDFIILKNRVPVPMEVKSLLERPDIPQGMRVFLKNYPESPFGVVINEKIRGETLQDGKKIFFKTWEEVQDLEFLRTIS